MREDSLTRARYDSSIIYRVRGGPIIPEIRYPVDSPLRREVGYLLATAAQGSGEVIRTIVEVAGSIAEIMQGVYELRHAR